MAYFINRISDLNFGVRCIDNVETICMDEPDYKAIITNANMRRRMSRIIKMSVSSALDCIKDVDSTQIEAIITATGLGCLHDTEKFMDNLMKYDEGALNPTTFIQSTFNTVSAQIALLLGLKVYNMTYVHGGLSFETALTDALLCLDEGKKQVLLGAFDELTETGFILQNKLGLFRNGIKAGEGAQFFLLGNERTEQTQAEIISAETFTNDFISSDINLRIKSFLSKNKLMENDVSLFISGKNGNVSKDIKYKKVEDQLFSKAHCVGFKQDCGEYPTAMAYGLNFAVQKLITQGGEYALLFNHHGVNENSLILIKKML